MYVKVLGHYISGLLSLAVNDLPLTGINTVNHFNTYFTSVASDLVAN